METKDIAEALGNLTVLELLALTKKLESQWGVKAAPQTVVNTNPVTTEVKVEQTEFDVVLQPVTADKKMGAIKLVREVMMLGLKESKDLVEAAPKLLKEACSKAEAEELKTKFAAVGATVELK